MKVTEHDQDVDIFLKQSLQDFWLIGNHVFKVFIYTNETSY